MAPEPESSSTPNSSLRDRYIALIDQIVTITLKGQLRSKEQIYQQLVQEVEVGTGEIFERCLTERLEATQAQVKQADDELKQARASRSLRAMQTIQGEWERYQKQQQASNALTRATEAILQAASTERLSVWLTYVDPNQGNRFNPEALKQLAQALERAVQF
ncbi:hypothetical protein [Leptolyngbya sp. 7M]|uniref:hypothetical protein n=1 Tax=Leptolyngbya sp. 7M TaxID=2812896 RepID=UPI001B8D76D2|nr:hypothetical protein [Leptolyngbya sp. 7M]QYO62106.1 hypothetical protein JVX88_18475 [Leptolyngbya sp. 7M]